jgi:hypothetical protein
MDEACSMNGEKRNPYRLLVGKPGVKRPLGRLGRWILERERGWVVWTGLVWLSIGTSGNLF